MIESITNFINEDHKIKPQGLINLMRERQLFSLAAGPHQVNQGEKHIVKIVESDEYKSCTHILMLMHRSQFKDKLL